MKRCSGTKFALFGFAFVAFGLLAVALANWVVHQRAVRQAIDKQAKSLFPLGARVYARPDGTIFGIEFNKPRSESLTDSDLRHLSSVGTVEYLDLSGTNISDEGLRALVPLARLRRLVLTDTNVTEEGVEFLRRSLPGCDIYWHHEQGDGAVREKGR